MLQKLKQFPILSTAILVALLVRLFVSGLTWVGVVALVLTVIWFVWDLLRWLMFQTDPPHRQPGKDSTLGEEPPENLISLVYFLSETRDADESSIRRCVSTALGINFDPNSPDSEHFVIQFTPPRDPKELDDDITHFMVRVPQGLFTVLVSGRPYISNPKQFARESIRDKRLRTAVEQHRAWVSVDLMDEPSDPESSQAAYRVIGQILATLAGPDCLAIYCPEIQRCNEFDLSLMEVLAGPKPLDLFREPTFEPIIEISDSNPKMADAVKEARNRWQEFLSAFQKSSSADTDRFIVKAEFREGAKCEYMWLSVTAASRGSFSGVLMNDPHELLDVHRGASVTLELDKLNDWIFQDEDGEHIGGFTLDVLAEGDDE